MKLFAAIGGMVWLSLLLGACGAATGAAYGSTGTKKITVEAKDFQFQPSAIELNVGEKVRLNFHNAGTVAHDFSVMEIPMSGPTAHNSDGHDLSDTSRAPQLHVFAAHGQNNSIAFTPTQPGAYAVICTAGGYQPTGMLATLVVK